jgi:hypothetical protein
MIERRGLDPEPTKHQDPAVTYQADPQKISRTPKMENSLARRGYFFANRERESEHDRREWGR